VICTVCRKAEAIGYEYHLFLDEPLREMCDACALDKIGPASVFEIFVPQSADIVDCYGPNGGTKVL